MARYWNNIPMTSNALSHFFQNTLLTDERLGSRSMSGRPAIGRATASRWLAYGDPMRILAVVAVVMIHVSATGVLAYDTLPAASWWIYNVADSASRWAVPVFVMLSGALLLPRREEAPSVFYRKRLKRIGIPLVFWSVFYLAWEHVIGDGLTASGAITRLLIGAPYAHLHFLFVIAGLYLFTPMLRVLFRELPPSTLLLLIALSLSLAVLDAPVRQLLRTRTSAFLKFVPYVGYYLAGGYLRNVRLSRKGQGIAGAVWLLTVIVTAIGTGILFAMTSAEGAGTLLYDYFSPLVVPMSVAAYLFISSVFSQPGAPPTRAGSLIQTLGRATFGVYLIHPAILDLVKRLIDPLTSPAMLVIVATPLIVLVTSFILAAALLEAPGLHRLID